MVNDGDTIFSRSVELVSARFRAGCVVSTKVVLDAAAEAAPKRVAKSYLGPESVNGRVAFS